MLARSQRLRAPLCHAGNVLQTTPNGTQATRVASTPTRTFTLSKDPARSTQQKGVRVMSTHSVSQTAEQCQRNSAAPSSTMYTTECGLWIDPALPRTFDKIVIANRGEIACRVIRTCRELGVKTVAVYSDQDESSMHVAMADEAYRIGEAEAASSYLLGDVILDVCKRSGAQAVHPGYGFLSENALFAGKCAESGIEFIGPPVPAIEAMGSKSASKEIMIAANVPVVPGYHGEDQSLETLRKEADRCGFPLMIKAVLGGGGKGMRIVQGQADFEEMLDQARNEAMKSFSDDRVLLERYIVRPRHIEFQVFADKHGGAVHLCERDCSVQRRHQKVLEEAPAPGMSDELREVMGKSAVEAALAVGYVGAGTVEFIFDAETDDYFFMEMNTRLQVEHPVTEMIMRRDLVQWQLHVASGHPLPASQAELTSQAWGHSLEARVYAENPFNNFLPAVGRLTHVCPPTVGMDVRVETGVRQGDTVSYFYDPMISKLVVWAPDRESCLRKMATALESYQVVGPPTNLAFLRRAVRHPAFAKGRVETGFIDEHMDALMPSTPLASAETNALAATALLLLERQKAETQRQHTADSTSPWNAASNLRLGVPESRSLVLKQELDHDPEAEHEVSFAVEYLSNGDFQLTMDDATAVSVRNASLGDKHVSAFINGQKLHATVVIEKESTGDVVHVFQAEHHIRFALPLVVYGKAAEGAGKGAVAPMAGKVSRVLVKPGQTVHKGEQLMVLTAMKLEHGIKSNVDGVVEAVLFQEGDQVDGGQTLVRFVEEEEEA